MNIKFSFVIPVYNVKEYLPYCLDSVLSQSYSNLEVILVDDGSNDGSGDLCDQLAVKDTRVKVVHKANGGLSDARNRGLLTASGEYVIFLDGDDFWRGKDSLEKLYFLLQDADFDFVQFNSYYYYPTKNSFKPWPAYDISIEEVTNKNVLLCTLISSGTFPMSACFKVIKKSFLLSNNLIFIKGLIGEDIPWFINLIENTTRCKFVNYYIYSYRQNVSSSITNSVTPKTFYSLREIIMTEIDKIGKRTFDKEAKDALLSFLGYEYSLLLVHLNVLEGKERKEAYSELKQYSWLLTYDRNPKTKLVGRLYKYFGLKNTCVALSLYYKIYKKLGPIIKFSK